MPEDGLFVRLLRGGFKGQNPRLRIDWMTHTDERIMEYLDEHGPTDTDTIATALEKSPEYAADRCRQLATRDLLAATDDGGYRLADRGAAYLAGEIDADELDNESES